jgi:pilus assembly protein CpaE
MSLRGHNSGTGIDMHGEFMGFVSDNESLTHLRDWALRQGFPAPTVQQGGADLFAQMLESSAPPQMVMIDIDGQMDAAAVIARLINLAGADCKIIALGSANDVALYRRILGAGAIDYLVKPLSSELLNQAMAAAMKNSRDGAQTKHEAKTIVVIGTRGGVGASTLAINVGWLMAHESKLNIALLDLDLQFGITSLALDLEPGHGLRDIVSSPHRVDGLMIASSMAVVSDRYSVLAAEEAIDDAVSIDNAAITALLSEMKDNFDFILVDLPRHLFAAQKRLLMSASDIVMVTELSLAGIRDTLRIKSALKNLECPAAVTVVGARTSASRTGHVDAPAFEKGTQCKIDIVIPEDLKSVALAANGGKALGVIAKNAPITKAMLALAHKLGGQSMKADQKKTAGLFGKMFNGKAKSKSSKAKEAKA